MPDIEHSDKMPNENDLNKSRFTSLLSQVTSLLEKNKQEISGLKEENRKLSEQNICLLSAMLCFTKSTGRMDDIDYKELQFVINNLVTSILEVNNDSVELSEENGKLKEENGKLREENVKLREENVKFLKLKNEHIQNRLNRFQQKQSQEEAQYWKIDKRRRMKCENVDNKAQTKSTDYRQLPYLLPPLDQKQAKSTDPQPQNPNPTDKRGPNIVLLRKGRRMLIR